MTTRCSMAITGSPGSGNFETRSVGWPTGSTGVLTRYISPTFALVLLVGRDLLRVRRPEDDGAIAAAPAGVVGGVAEVLRRRRSSAAARVSVAMSRTHRFQSRMKAARLPSGDENGRARRAAAARSASAAAPAACFRLRRRRAEIRAARSAYVARPAAAVEVERDGLAVGREVDRLKRQLVRRELAAGRGRKGGGELRVIERRPARASRGRHQDELEPVRRLVPVPESLVGQPVGGRRAADDRPGESRGKEPLGAGVVGRGDGRAGLRFAAVPGRWSARRSERRRSPRQAAARPEWNEEWTACGRVSRRSP